MKQRGEARILGLTSPANVAFTQGLGAYDTVLPYDAVDTMDTSISTAFVDIAGNSAVRAAVHRHFGDKLVYSCGVGATHWDVPGSSETLPGAPTKMFFAPDVVKKRMTDWGPAGFHQRAGQAWRDFLPIAARTTSIVEGQGLKDAARVFNSLASGRANPRDGHVIRLVSSKT